MLILLRKSSPVKWWLTGRVWDLLHSFSNLLLFLSTQSSLPSLLQFTSRRKVRMTESRLFYNSGSSRSAVLPFCFPLFLGDYINTGNWNICVHELNYLWFSFDGSLYHLPAHNTIKKAKWLLFWDSRSLTILVTFSIQSSCRQEFIPEYFDEQINPPIKWQCLKYSAFQNQRNMKAS